MLRLLLLLFLSSLVVGFLLFPMHSFFSAISQSFHFRCGFIFILLYIAAFIIAVVFFSHTKRNVQQQQNWCDDKRNGRKESNKYKFKFKYLDSLLDFSIFYVFCFAFAGLALFKSHFHFHTDFLSHLPINFDAKHKYK